MAPVVSFHIMASLTLLLRVTASDFLGIAQVTPEELESTLLAELANSHHPKADATKARIASLEAQLRPMYSVMPQEGDGSLSHDVVRYMLHRFFVSRHGWFIRGLEPGSESRFASYNASHELDHEQAMQAKQEWVPSYLQKFLEGVIGKRGVLLREVAAFVATLEDIVFKEEHGHLQRAYQSLHLDTEKALDEAGAQIVLQTYMMIFMLRGNFSARNPEEVWRLLQLFTTRKAGWHTTMVWLTSLLRKHIASDVSSIDFKAMSNVVEDVGDQYGIVNNEDCRRLKGELMRLESKKPGRVRLTDFYKNGLNGTWEFNEKVEYLRAIGTLDETDPSTPLVILPNYVAARPNCLVVSSFYVACCRNECEHLLERLESEIGSSTAHPSRISAIISSLPSDTIAAPRTLSPLLLQRLQEIAQLHGGEVPLHGRLFAQWMHHAYPRECPYPHEAGSISPETPDEWMQKTGQDDSTATMDEMMARIRHDSCKFLPNGVECENKDVQDSAVGEDEDLPWDSKEELLIAYQVAPAEMSSMEQYGLTKPFHDLMYFLALSAMIYMAGSLMQSNTKAKVFRMGLPSSARKSDRCSV